MRTRDSGEFIRTLGFAGLLTVVGFVVAYQFIEPAPPRVMTIATGRGDGAYQRFALRYREVLARDGVELRIRSTAGSVENLALLKDAGSGVNLAFIQGGVGEPEESPELLSLGSLFLEPVWLIQRANNPRISSIAKLRGQRLAIGAVGSGTRALVTRLLDINGIGDGNSTLMPLSGQQAVDAVVNDQADAAFLVVSAQAPMIRELVGLEKIQVMSLRRAEAYTRLMAYLTVVELPEGVIDMEHDIPSRNITLLATTATLVTRDDLHPALVDLLLQAAAEVHTRGGLFEQARQFPSPEFVEFPLNDNAERYYQFGPPFLQRVLPFWAATLVDQLKVLLLPFLFLVIPLFRLLPPMYRWRIRSRVFRWYDDLERLDKQADYPISEQERRIALEELEQVAQAVKQVHVPNTYAHELFAMRMYIDQVRQRLQAAAYPGGKQASARQHGRIGL